MLLKTMVGMVDELKIDKMPQVGVYMEAKFLVRGFEAAQET